MEWQYCPSYVDNSPRWKLFKYPNTMPIAVFKTKKKPLAERMMTVGSVNQLSESVSTLYLDDQAIYSSSDKRDFDLFRAQLLK